jgi:hypothetical protein
MTPLGSGRTLEAGTPGRLRAAALIVVLAAAVGSVGLMLRAGRHSPRILMVLIGTWVLAPYVALVLFDRVSTRWQALTRATLHGVMLVIAVGSLVVYGYDVVHPQAKAAFVYVAVPLASWVLVALAVPLAALVSSRRAHRRP